MSERDGTGGLDDLFAIRDEAPVEEAAPVEVRQRSWLGWALRNALLVAVATVVAVAALRSADIAVSTLLIVAAFVALRLLMLAVAQVSPPKIPKSLRRRRANAADEDGLYKWAGTDAVRAAVRRWEQRLQWSQSDPDAFSRNVLPVLAELTDERLRLKHGITRGTDPRRARELLGEPFWQALSEPGRRPPKAKDMAAYVETLERL